MATSRPLDVSVASEGERLSGLLYLPEGAGPHPVVVMAGGWCYVKELVQPRYAEVFAAAGVAALVFDYRHLGASDGEPRQHIDPASRSRTTATRSPSSRPATRSMPSGSASGASPTAAVTSLILAATDARVKAVCSIVPVIDGWETCAASHGT